MVLCPALTMGACKCREHKAEGKEAKGRMGRGILYWLRQDFRLHDNPALSAAAQAAKKQACAHCESREFCGVQ